MNVNRRVTLSLLAMVGLTLGSLACDSGKQQAAEMTQAQKIARGRQISYSSACNDCHTPGGLYGNPDSTRLMSGSELGWEGPWGVTYPRNLTPDPETGIPTWTEEDIVNAFRQGHRPDGSPLLPPMPWPTYAYMSDEDAYALAAFIKSLPPINHRVPDRVAPGGVALGPKVTIPPPPEWDGRHMTPPATGATTP